MYRYVIIPRSVHPRTICFIFFLFLEDRAFMFLFTQDINHLILPSTFLIHSNARYAVLENTYRKILKLLLSTCLFRKSGKERTRSEIFLRNRNHNEWNGHKILWTLYKLFVRWLTIAKAYSRQHIVTNMCGIHVIASFSLQRCVRWYGWNCSWYRS